MDQRIVCAANRHPEKQQIILGARHWDAFMCEQTKESDLDWAEAEQGFIDQRGNFLTRQEAWEVAKAAGQIVRRVGGDEGCLYSENLY